MEQGSWLDWHVLAAFTLAAREVGLKLRSGGFLSLSRQRNAHTRAPPDQMLVCGMSLGYADPDAQEHLSYRASGCQRVPKHLSDCGSTGARNHCGYDHSLNFIPLAM